MIYLLISFIALVYIVILFIIAISNENTKRGQIRKDNVELSYRVDLTIEQQNLVKHLLILTNQIDYRNHSKINDKIVH